MQTHKIIAVAILFLVTGLVFVGGFKSLQPRLTTSALPIQSNSSLYTSPSGGCYLNLQINETKSGGTMSFSLSGTEVIYGNNSGLVTPYPPHTGDYILKAYNGSTLLGSFALDSSRFIIYDDFANNTGGIIELNDGVIDTVIPYNPGINSLKIENNGQLTTLNFTLPSAPDCNPIVDTAPPTTRPVLTLTKVSGSSIMLDWTEVFDNTNGSGIAGYKVNRNSVSTTTPAPFYFDSGLADNGLSYCYNVAALDNLGNVGPQSSPSQCITLPTDTLAPSIPTGLIATPISQTQVNLSWSPSTDNPAPPNGTGVGGYLIYRGNNFLATSTIPMFQHTGLRADTRYCYKVLAFDFSQRMNKSNKSSEVCGRTVK